MKEQSSLEMEPVKLGIPKQNLFESKNTTNITLKYVHESSTIDAMPGVTGQGESTPSLVPSPSWAGSLRANNQPRKC